MVRAIVREGSPGVRRSTVLCILSYAVDQILNSTLFDVGICAPDR